MNQDTYQATGRRKESTAQVRMSAGTGIITVNGRPMPQYFHRETLEAMVRQPFEATQTLGRYDVMAQVSGGGVSGQAGALRHGIARALAACDEKLHGPLRKGGFLTRDPRMVERKKYGQRGARARFQFSKR